MFITINQMETKEIILLILLKEKKKTASELAEQLKKTRPGIWKSLNNLHEQELVVFESANSKKTSIKIVKLNYKNPLIKKTLSLILTKQAIETQRWVDNFSKLEKYVNFVILFGSILNDPNKAKDIDLLIVSEKKNFKKIEELISEIQKTQSKKIHFIQLTPKEFYNEIKFRNKAYLDAIKKGIVLFGQDNFIKQMEKLNEN
jgi:predicted transcriptional regulator